MSEFKEFWNELSWPKIVGETLIVVVGVFLGIQASNWNDERNQRAEDYQVLQSLKPELEQAIENYDSLTRYYAVTRRYATTAFAGWAGDPNVSDREFVIAAYQASQNSFTGINSGSWSTVFGSDRLRNLADQHLRRDLALLMTQDYTVLEQELFTDYRQDVRRVIPEDIQDAIRADCGDQRYGEAGFTRLPTTCRLDLPDDRFAAAARALRAHPELVGELRWHFAAVATYVGNIQNLDTIAKRTLKEIDAA